MEMSQHFDINREDNEAALAWQGTKAAAGSLTSIEGA